MTHQWFVQHSSDLLAFSQKVIGKTATEYCTKHTVARVFSAGETIPELQGTILALKKYVRYKQPFYPVVDFAAEGVQDVSNSAEMDENTTHVISGIEEAGKSPYGASAVKFTALIGTPLLQKVSLLQLKANQHMKNLGLVTSEFDGLYCGSLFPHLAPLGSKIAGVNSHPSVNRVIEELSPEERQLISAFLGRVERVADSGTAQRVNILIDAEQTYYQTAVDALTFDLQEVYNKSVGRIENTYQCYLRATEGKFQSYIRATQSRGLKLGAKLVRGAYMIEESALAQKQQRPNPIHEAKGDTDKCYNSCLGHFINNMQSGDSLTVASHNPESVALGQLLMEQRHIDKLHGGIKFAQLMGMKHKLSVELAQAGYITQKYLPFGPISRLIPYLSRRAHESYGIRDQIEDQIKQIQAEIRIRTKVF